MGRPDDGWLDCILCTDTETCAEHTPKPKPEQQFGPPVLYVQYHKSGTGPPVISHDLLPGHVTVKYVKAKVK